MEVECNDPELFRRIFNGAEIKEVKKDGKLSVSLKTEEEARKCGLRFKRTSYKGKTSRHYDMYVCAPYTESLKYNKMTFTFKFARC